MPTKYKMVNTIIVASLLMAIVPTTAYADSNALGWRGNSFYKTDEDRYKSAETNVDVPKATPKRSLTDIFKNIEFSVKTSTDVKNINAPKDETYGDADTDSSSVPIKNSDIVEIARKYIGVPYVWGGKTPESGFDCSGFVSYVYKEYGVSIPSYTLSLMEEGDKVAIERFKNGIYSDLVPGDLMISPEHVTMYTGNGKMIHAPDIGQSVKEVDIASWWTTNVTHIRRIIN